MGEQPLPGDRDESMDEDLLFVVEDMEDETAQKPARATPPARGAPRGSPRRSESAAARVERTSDPARVIVGSKKPLNPLYGKMMKYGALIAAGAVLIAVVPYLLGILGRMHWGHAPSGEGAAVRPSAHVAAAHPAPQPDTTEPVASDAPPETSATPDALAAAASADGAPPDPAAPSGGESSAAAAAAAPAQPSAPGAHAQSIDEFLAQLDDQERAHLETQSKAAAGSDDAQSTAQSRETIIELKNGSHFRGMVKKMTDDQVILSYAHGTYTFARADLSRIIPPGSREYLPLDTFPEALVKLKAGGRFKAHVLKDSDDRIVLGFDAGKLTFKKSDVESIEYERPDDAPFKAELPKFEFPKADQEEPPGPPQSSSNQDAVPAGDGGQAPQRAN